MIRFLPASATPSELRSADWICLANALTKTLRFRRTYEVGVTFVTEASMQQLNRRFRGKDRATDVLSFATADHTGPNKEEGYLGDLVICPKYAAREAARRSLSLREELIRLLAHGVLHLAGYDHATAADEMRMFAKQERCVNACFEV